MRKTLFLFGCLLLVGGCRGPKGSPDGTVSSFYSAVAAQDWEAAASTFTTASLAKHGSGEVAASLSGQFQGWSDIEVQVGDSTIDSGGTTATVHFTCIGESIVRYKVVKFDCSDILSLVKEDDGKWHIVPPSARKLRNL